MIAFQGAQTQQGAHANLECAIDEPELIELLGHEALAHARKGDEAPEARVGVGRIGEARGEIGCFRDERVALEQSRTERVGRALDLGKQRSKGAQERDGRLLSGERACRHGEIVI